MFEQVMFIIVLFIYFRQHVLQPHAATLCVKSNIQYWEGDITLALCYHNYCHIFTVAFNTCRESYLILRQ